LVAVVSDSTCDLPDPLLAALGIPLAPVHIQAEDRSYRDRLDMSIDEANAIMLAGKTRLTTSAATAADWLEAYEKALPLAPELVALSISPLLSATFAGANAASELLEGGSVTVINAQTILAAMGLVVRQCARAAQSGQSRDQVVALAEHLLPRVKMVVASMYRSFAKAGGRYQGDAVPESDEGLPIFRIWEKGWMEIDRADKRAASIDRLFHWMDADLQELGYVRGNPLLVAVDHFACLEEAEAIRDRIEHLYHPQELDLWQIGPTAAVHLGPGTVGMAYLPL
jgi:DegV family protein with EDD domain